MCSNCSSHMSEIAFTHYFAANSYYCFQSGGHVLIISLLHTTCAGQVSQEQFDKVMGLIKSGIDQGAKLETGGKRYGVWVLLLCSVHMHTLKGVSGHQGWALSSLWFQMHSLKVRLVCCGLQGRRGTTLSRRCSAMWRTT